MKFSIRDLFLVTMIVALGLGWWTDRRAASHRDALKSEYIKKLKKELLFDIGELKLHQMQKGHVRGIHPNVHLPPELENEPK
jgi:hypothetical protein